MAVHLLTNNPSALLAAFKLAIKEGHVETWSVDSQGDFTHTPPQWNKLAWFRPELRSDRVVLKIVKPQNGSVSWEVYGIYHGRIIESFIIHCNNLFSEGYASAKPTIDDVL